MPSRATSALARRTLLLVLASSILGGCVKEGVAKMRRRVARGRAPHDAVWTPATMSGVQNVQVAEVKAALDQRLAGDAPAGVEKDAWQHTRSLYKSLGGTPLWLTSDGLAKDRVGALLDAVLGVTADGLRIDAYPLVPLGNALATVKKGNATAAQWADADVLLSATYAAMGEDLLSGQVDPKTVNQSWHIKRESDDVDSALVHSLADTLSTGIAEMRPPEEVYTQLQKELVRYRDIESKGGWPKIPAGKTVKAGQSTDPARIEALRKRLAIEGYDVGGSTAAATTDSTTKPAKAVKPAATGSGVYDAALANAVGEYQKRHAITVDRSLSPETVNSLNVPAAYRLGQIAANLERYRWMPRTLGTRYIYVNVPAFQLTAYDSGEKTLDMKVIVGQEFEDKATPVFSDSMEMVVFRPYWNITPDIQAKEVGPKIAADPSYLERENLEYYKDGGVTRIRQKPGPKNALGFVKFLFPNDFNIYLHDTPNHELFNKDVRAFSHGCIRLEKPAELAQWVLGWDAARVQAAMDGGADNNTVRLKQKIPVYIIYGTAFVRDGQLYFGNDLYHRDEALVKAVAGGALPSESAKAALEQLKKIASA